MRLVSSAWLVHRTADCQSLAGPCGIASAHRPLLYKARLRSVGVLGLLLQLRTTPQQQRKLSETTAVFGTVHLLSPFTRKHSAVFSASKRRAFIIESVERDT